MGRAHVGQQPVVSELHPSLPCAQYVPDKGQGFPEVCMSRLLLSCHAAAILP
jgi:hypothetical protein